MPLPTPPPVAAPQSRCDSGGAVDNELSRPSGPDAPEARCLHSLEAFAYNISGAGSAFARETAKSVKWAQTSIDSKHRITQVIC